WPDSIAQVNADLTRYADRAAGAGTDPTATGMATTFVGAAIPLGSKPRTASIAWTDDSTVWQLADKEWTKLTVVAAEAEGALHTAGVRALPHRQPRFHTVEVVADTGALFVMSDGVGVPLESSKEVRDTLARWWALPPDVFTFARQVGFARKSHMDDRTVVGV